MIKPGEIVHCNLVFLNKRKETIIIKDVVFGRPFECEFQTQYKINSNADASFLLRHKIEEDMELTSVDVIKSLGYKNYTDKSPANYTTASKSETDERQANGAFM